MRVRPVFGSVFCIAILSTAATDSPPPLSFAARREIPAGYNPYAMAIADFNGDGKPDLMVTNSGAISLMLGNGDGSFQPPATRMLSAVVRGIASGDFNGDGRPDAVTANPLSNTISVLLGRGDGTFQDPVDYAAGVSPYAVATADFNGDGKLDLATANYGNSTVSVLLGKGDGTFQAAVPYPTGGALPFGVTTADFNGDGKADIAIANYGSNTVSVLIGKGDGAFQAAASFAVGTSPSAVIAADVNKDGKPDVITANAGSNDVSIALGKGDGTFQTATSLNVGTSPYSVAAGDLDGDGIPDLVAANNGSSTVSVLIGTASGTFKAAVSYNVTGSPYGIALADVNGDSKLDILTPGYSAGVVSVLAGNGNGTFQDAILAQTPPCEPPFTCNPPYGAHTTSVVLQDFDRDGKADLAYLDTDNFYTSLYLALGKGDGKFQAPVSVFQPGTNVTSVAATDFNGDGKPDLAVIYSGNVAVLLGNENGTFQTPLTCPGGGSPSLVLTADFNKDGKADLAVGNLGGNVYILLGKGDGTFQAPVNVVFGSYIVANPYGPVLVIADFNNDGKLDLAVSLNTGDISVALGNGDGTFQTANKIGSVSNSSSGLAAGDFSGDGKSDLIVTTGTGPYMLTAAAGGTFNPPRPLSGLTGFPFFWPYAADFDGDGKTDLAFTARGTGLSFDGVAVLRGRGNGDFDPPALFGGVSTMMLTGWDVNGDGNADLVTSGYGGIFILLNNRPAPPSTVIASSPAGRAFTADGVAYTAPQTFLWPAGSSHIVSWTSPQTSGTTQYTFTGWADGNAANPRSIMVPSGGGTFTANFSSGSLCTFALSGDNAIPAAGGSGTITVTTLAGCAWTASSNAPWLTITSGSSGTGSGTIAYTAAANTLAAPRTAQVFAGGSSIVLTQAGAACSFIVMPLVVTIPAAGGTGTVNVTPSSAGCHWSVASNASWITITGVNTSGTVTFSVPSGQGRSGTLTIAGQTVTVNQSGRTGLRFVPATPCRVADTRASEGLTGAFGPPGLARAATRDFPLPAGRCSIPAGAAAYSLNITAIPAGALAYLTAWPTGEARPVASTLNSFNGRVVANAAILAAGAQGAISVFASDPADVVIDIDGYFVPATDPAGLAFYPVAPCRVSDSRAAPPFFNAGGTARDIDVRGSACSIPAAAKAYSLNVTSVPRGFLGYLTIWPSGQAQPLVSTLNSWNGQVVPNAAIVPAGTNGAVSVYVSNAADVVIDINGYFAPPGAAGALDYYPVVPCRVADTRAGSGFPGDFGPPSIPALGMRTIPVADGGCPIPHTALAYSLNATAVPPAQLGFVTLWPAGQAMPLASTLNSFDGQIVANMAIVPAGTNGAISVYAADRTDIILDINGYFAPSGP